MAEGERQKAGGRGQKGRAEGRGQGAEGRRQRVGGRRQRVGGRRQEAEGRGQKGKDGYQVVSVVRSDLTHRASAIAEAITLRTVLWRRRARLHKTVSVLTVVATAIYFLFTRDYLLSCRNDRPIVPTFVSGIRLKRRYTQGSPGR
jgi:hypothetical protein